MKDSKAELRSKSWRRTKLEELNHHQHLAKATKIKIKKQKKKQ